MGSVGSFTLTLFLFCTRRGHDVIAAIPYCMDKTEYNYTIICSDPEENIMNMIDSVTEPLVQKTDSSIITALTTVTQG